MSGRDRTRRLKARLIGGRFAICYVGHCTLRRLDVSECVLVLSAMGGSVPPDYPPLTMSQATLRLGLLSSHSGYSSSDSGEDSTDSVNNCLNFFCFHKIWYKRVKQNHRRVLKENTVSKDGTL